MDSNKLVVAISGKARNGKDTVAEIMKSQLASNGMSPIIIHFADLLKFICKTYFGWNGEKDERGRALLQYIGTEVVRNRDKDYWVNHVIGVLNMLDDYWDIAIIPDTRFPNEIDTLCDNGFQVVHLRVVRNEDSEELTNEQKQHSSETSLNSVIPDIIIDNNGTIDELKGKIKKLTEDICRGKQRND